MFRFINQVFIGLLGFVGSSATKCVSLNNQPYEVRTALLNVNSNETICYLLPLTFSVAELVILLIIHPRTCVPNKTKKMNLKVFHLSSRVNETRFLVQHESGE